LTKSPAIPQQLYKPASRGLSAILAELLVTNKSLFLANDAWYRHSYYGRRMGTRMRSIRWCHFQWPWTNS